MKRLGHRSRCILLAAALAPSLSLAQAAPPAGGTTPTRRHLGFFLRPELGYGRLQMSVDGQTDEILGHGGWGFGVRVGLGKESWVSDRWGLGLSGGLTVTENRVSRPADSTWATLAFNFGLSATFQ